MWAKAQKPLRFVSAATATKGKTVSVLMLGDRKLVTCLGPKYLPTTVFIRAAVPCFVFKCKSRPGKVDTRMPHSK